MAPSASRSRSRSRDSPSPPKSRGDRRSRDSSKSPSPPYKRNRRASSEKETEGKSHHNNDHVKSNGNEDKRKEPSRSRSRSRQRRHSSGEKEQRPRTRSKTGSPVDRKTRSRSRDRRRRRSSSSPHRRNRSPVDEDGYRIHVADLDSSASKRELEKIFGKFGPLKEIWMARSIPCFAFVVYRYRADAEDAVRLADGVEVANRRIRVTHARPRTKGKGRRGFDPNMRCYQCGDRGHFSRDCPDSKYGYKRPSPGRYGGGGRDRNFERGYDRRRY